MSFLEFARGRGLIVDWVIADGRIHRVRTEDHPHKRNGAYSFDGKTGFCQNWTIDERAIVYRDSSPAIDRAELARLREMRRRDEAQMRTQARRRALDIINGSVWCTHPYLAAKGFPQECALVNDGRLVIPMWDYQNYGKLLHSAQTITAAGEKKFLLHGKTAGAVFRLGTGGELWHCEGYATALSVRDALAKLYRRATVVVNFSAHNLSVVAKALGGRVVADNDESGTGERAARATGLPYVMPPVEGMDANDYERAKGKPALVELLRGLL